MVAYAQSSPTNQKLANDSAPLRVFVLEMAGYIGGFSPGRTFGPDVATVGVGLGEVVGAVGVAEVGTADVVGRVEVGAEVLPSEPLLVHATAPARIRAIAAICRICTPMIFA